jgi:hypothetical protein
MAVFIPSKTDIQCRSHHHKFELKYKYPYRIVKEEKTKLEELGLSFYGALLKFAPRPAVDDEVGLRKAEKDQFKRDAAQKTPGV